LKPASLSEDLHNLYYVIFHWAVVLSLFSRVAYRINCDANTVTKVDSKSREAKKTKFLYTFVSNFKRLKKIIIIITL
jgi:hypothetical protein